MVLIVYRYYSFEANDFSNVIVGLYSASVFSTQIPFGTMYHVNGACQKPAAIILLRNYYGFFYLVAKRQLVENNKLPYKKNNTGKMFIISNEVHCMFRKRNYLYYSSS